MKKHGNQNTWLVAIVAIVAIVALILFKGGGTSGATQGNIGGEAISTGTGGTISSDSGKLCGKTYGGATCPSGEVCGTDGRCMDGTKCERCRRIKSNGGSFVPGTWCDSNYEYCPT